MKDKTKELFKVNSDILTIMVLTKKIGWKSINKNSIHRILYLSNVLHYFIYNRNYDTYSFSVDITGAYSSQIEHSLTNLLSRENIIKDADGNLTLNIDLTDEKLLNKNELDWFRTLIYILGLYGERKVFGFVMKDPEFHTVFMSNSPKELDTTNTNETIKVLNSFKKAFEETLDNTSEISNKEYLELYFEYVFSKIIKRDN